MSSIKQKHEMMGNKQQGFVLVLALVLLAVMTLIGVSSMNSANMELKATANAQQHQFAFNAGQSIIEFAVSTDTANDLDFQTSDPTPQKIGPDVAGVTSTAEMVYAGCSVGIGSSLQEGKGFSYNFFNITGTGSNSAKTATSIQAQGVRFPTAACAN